MENQRNIQDSFLNLARKTGVSITVFLVNGFQMRGTVSGYDCFTVVLDTDGKQQLIYKHAISTIIPARPLRLASPDSADT